MLRKDTPGNMDGEGRLMGGKSVFTYLSIILSMLHCMNVNPCARFFRELCKSGSELFSMQPQRAGIQKVLPEGVQH